MGSSLSQHSYFFMRYMHSDVNQATKLDSGHTDLIHYLPEASQCKLYQTHIMTFWCNRCFHWYKSLANDVHTWNISSATRLQMEASFDRPIPVATWLLNVHFTNWLYSQYRLSGRCNQPIMPQSDYTAWWIPDDFPGDWRNSIKYHIALQTWKKMQ